MTQPEGRHAATPDDGGRSRGGLRTDIQGMRALAVGVVLVYHVMPDWLTGGFVGVDVFFVISGFLITSHLVARPPARARDFAQFWARRARRLLPASLLVLAVTLLATRLLGPETLWNDTARQGAGATAYVVNWMLAADAVDYLAAENVLTGVQHYWSLSVEEQFYAVWPLLIALLAWLAVRLRVRREIAWAAGLGVVAAASLAWSVHLTATDPGRAYFVTTTRMWELAVGGLVALLMVARPPRFDVSFRFEVFRALLAWAGLGAIVYASVSFDAATPFPSWRAGIPVLGAAALVLACCGMQWFSPGRVLALRPVQWLGDVSYAVYLWHWPIVVLVGARSAPIGLLDAAMIVALTLVLAQLTKTFVEDPFRAKVWNVRLGLTYRLAAAGMVVVMAAAFVQQWEVGQRADAETARIDAAMKSGQCTGAAARAPGAPCDGDQSLVLSPAGAAKDMASVFSTGEDRCVTERPAFVMKTCTFGDPDGELEVALIGNSHAAHFAPAVQEMAQTRGMRMTTRLALACSLTTARQDFATAPGQETPEETENCAAWVDRVVDEVIADDPDLVLVSNRLAHPAVGKTRNDSGEAFTEGYVEVLSRLANAGIPVAVLRATPVPLEGGKISSVPDCVSTNGADSKRCTGTRKAWLVPAVDPAVEAVDELDEDRVRSVDLTDRICGRKVCHTVVGGVIVYFDGSHLTATFARSLAPALDEALVAADLLPGS